MLPYVALAVATVVVAVAVTQTAVFATTVYLHRCLAHGSVELRPSVRAVSRVAIWITTALKPRQWAQVHRYHHATEDTADDPHSPRNYGGGAAGAWHIVWRNAPLYTHATRDRRLAAKYRDLQSDRWDRWLFDRGELGLVIGIAALSTVMAAVGQWLVGGTVGIVVGIAAGLIAAALHAAMYVLAGGAINGFGHAGTVDAPIGGYAKNMPVLAWFTGGEGWHRNHHAVENSPRFGCGRQIDLGWLAICALRGVRLAYVTTRGDAALRRLATLNAALRTDTARDFERVSR